MVKQTVTEILTANTNASIWQAGVFRDGRLALDLMAKDEGMACYSHAAAEREADGMQERLTKRGIAATRQYLDRNQVQLSGRRFA